MYAYLPSTPLDNLLAYVKARLNKVDVRLFLITVINASDFIENISFACASDLHLEHLVLEVVSCKDLNMASISVFKRVFE